MMSKCLLVPSLSLINPSTFWSSVSTVAESTFGLCDVWGACDVKRLYCEDTAEADPPRARSRYYSCVHPFLYCQLLDFVTSSPPFLPRPVSSSCFAVSPLASSSVAASSVQTSLGVTSHPVCLLICLL